MPTVGYTAYRELEDSKYLVEHMELTGLTVNFNWDNLTPIEY